MIKIIIIFLPFLPPSSLLLQSWNWAPFLLQCWLPLCYKNSKPKNNAKTTTTTTATRNHTGKCTNEEGVGHNILGLCLLYLHYDLTVFSLRKQSNSCQLKTHQAGLPMWEVVKIVGEGNMGRGTWGGEGGPRQAGGCTPPCACVSAMSFPIGSCFWLCDAVWIFLIENWKKKRKKLWTERKERERELERKKTEKRKTEIEGVEVAVY